MYAIRQTIVKHIITVSPDVSQLFHDEEGYKKQEVTLGADNGKSVQILSGVKAGDRVVTQGAYQVKLASASNAIPAHSHEH